MPDVTDNSALNRFEMAVDGHIAFVVYRRQPPSIELLHAEVPAQLEGRGAGSHRLYPAPAAGCGPSGSRGSP